MIKNFKNYDFYHDFEYFGGASMKRAKTSADAKEHPSKIAVSVSMLAGRELVVSESVTLFSRLFV